MVFRFNALKDTQDKEKAKILEEILLFERSRFIFLIEAFLKVLLPSLLPITLNSHILNVKVVKEQANLGSLLAAINNDMPRWEAKAADREAFTVPFLSFSSIFELSKGVIF